MIFKTLMLIGILGSNVSADKNLRTQAKHEEAAGLVEESDRELFPLLPGTRCPTGTLCNKGVMSPLSPMSSNLRDSFKTPLAASFDWKEFDKNMDTVVESSHYCNRRAAMARAAGLAAGMAASAVNSPAFAAETKEVKMGADNGGLNFVPSKVTICKGDSVTWINNKSGPHNVVFDEEAVPAGVDTEKISMEDQLGEEGETFTMKFETAGEYSYYCFPHRGAGMIASLIVV